MKKYAIVALLIGTIAMAGSDDDRLGLHADDGVWGFHGCAEKVVELPTVLVIGDSIVNGYREPLKSALRGKANVDVWLTPMHLNGKGLHADMKKVLAQDGYAAIHFNIGLHGWPEGRIPEGTYEPLLRAYLDSLRAGAPTATLIWGSTTPITVKGDATQLDPINNPTIVRRNAIAASVMIYLEVDNRNAVVTVNVINTQSGSSKSYRVMKNDIHSDGFTTTEGVQVFVAGIERIEIESR